MVWKYHKGNYRCPRCNYIVEPTYIHNFSTGINKNLRCPKCKYSGYIGYIREYKAEDKI